jgi:hypothetical protein
MTMLALGGVNTLHVMNPVSFRMSLILAGLVVATGASTGCNSPQPSGATSATPVIVTNRTPEEIKAAATETFKRHEYEPVPGEGPDLAFQKPGTFVNNLMSSDWFDGPSWVMVKVYQHPLDAERTRLDCRVFLVQQPDDPLFKTEHPYGGHRKDFENLIHEIGRNLNQSPEKPAQ